MANSEAEATRPPWFDGRMPRLADCFLLDQIARAARESPERVFALFEDGERWTWSAALERIRVTAAGLKRLGVAAGDYVINWQPNGADHLRVWLAANYLGAVNVPINVAYRGAILEHVIANSGARIMVAHAALAGRLAGLSPGGLRAVVVAKGDAPRLDNVEVLGADVLERPAHEAPQPLPTQPWDTACIAYTSGTTGLSKGVIVPYGQLWTYVQACFGFMTREDRMLVTTPLCHIGPICGVIAAIVLRASVAIQQGFKAEDYWRVVRETGATIVPGMVMAMLEYLAKAPPRPDDADNPLRYVSIRSASDTVLAFARRFGVDYYSGFGMSEAPLPLVTEVNSAVLHSCGKPRTGVEVRLVDEHDMEVPVGAVGEITIRPTHPWTMSVGYHNAPEATAQAWRNGWFHSGDAAWRDQDGNYFFVDRIKDSIRRRGENISATEIEREAAAFRSVANAAAVGVTGLGVAGAGDQEVLLVVSPAPDKSIDPRELTEHLIARLPHFMVPRYIRILPELPRTYTGKISKAELRKCRSDLGLLGPRAARAAGQARQLVVAEPHKEEG
jgi:crotonobetaine/carnitine-CoA ligase